MENMPVEEEFEEVLLNIELRAKLAFDETPTLTDYVVAEVYDALVLHYTAIAASRTPPKPRVREGLAMELFEQIQRTCDICLVESYNDPKVKKSPIQRITAQDLVRCFKRLQQSVKLWTKKGGRQGYLNFVSQFI
ncbi:MAG: hypothetical protein MUF71_18595 [Candidatus Kapabacteria bacterium]|nr:hypothetical protein [Candidatus Kapabacteria bacterium]